MSGITRKLMGVKKGASVAAVSVSYEGYVYDDVNRSSYTFTNAPIGTAASDRLVVIPIFALAGSAVITPTVTVGGISATKILGPIVNSSNGRTYLYSVEVPTGTTATITVNVGSSVFRCYIPIYSVYGAEPIPLDFASTFLSGVTSASVSVNTVPDGAVIGFAEFVSTGSPAMDWTGVTEDFDVVPEPGSNRRVSSGTVLTTATESRTITVEAATGANINVELGAVSFEPA